MSTSAQPQLEITTWITSAIGNLIVILVTSIGLVDVLEWELPKALGLYRDVSLPSPQVFQVTDQQGTVVPSFPMMLNSKGREQRVLLTNEKGLATVAGLDPGEYQLTLPDDEPKNPRAITIEKGRSAVIAVTVSDHFAEVVKGGASPAKRTIEVSARKAPKVPRRTQAKKHGSLPVTSPEPSGAN